MAKRTTYYFSTSSESSSMLTTNFRQRSSSSTSASAATKPKSKSNPAIDRQQSGLSKAVVDMMSTISPVTPYLSVSGCLPVSAQNLLKDDYTAAVCCMDGFDYQFPKDAIDFINIRIEDTRDTDLRPYFAPVCQMIEKHRLKRKAPGGRGRTLVFCAQGVSRSVSFVLAYLMIHAKMPLIEAYDHVLQRRRLACPNVGFFKQLIELEKQVFGSQTVRMLEPVKGFEVADVVWRRGDDLLKAFEGE